MVDAEVRLLDLKKIGEVTLKDAIDPNDGNSLGPNWDE